MLLAPATPRRDDTASWRAPHCLPSAHGLHASQVARVCDELLGMEELRDGYVAVGFSQARRQSAALQLLVPAEACPRPLPPSDADRHSGRSFAALRTLRLAGLGPGSRVLTAPAAPCPCPRRAASSCAQCCNAAST